MPGKPTYEDLEQAIRRLKKESARDRQALEELNKESRKLGERIKELDCLYGLSKLLETPKRSIEGVLRETADLLPTAWPLPTMTRARIVLDGTSYPCRGFREGKRRQAEELLVHGRKAGIVEVFCLEEQPGDDDAPVPEGKRRLLHAVALRLGRMIEEKRTERAVEENEKRHLRIAETVADYMFTSYIENGKVERTVHGPGCPAITGYSAEDFASDPRLWFNLVVPEDRERVEKFTSRILAGKSVEPLEHRIRKKNGRVRWIAVTAVPHYDPSGVLISYDGLVRDITKRKQVETALRESEEKYRILVENAGEAVFVAQEGLLKFVNRKSEEIIGYAREDLLSRPFTEFLHPEDRALVLQRHIQRQQGMEPPSAYSFRVVQQSGDTRWVELKSVRIEWEGKPATLNFLSDITEQRRFEEQRQRQMEEIERFNRLAVGREQRILELKGQVNRLCQSLGRPQPYAAAVGEDPVGVADAPEDEEFTSTVEHPAECVLPLSELIDLNEFQELMHGFSESTGIASAIIDLQGVTLVQSHWKRLCTDFHRVNETTRRRCIESDTQLAIRLKEGKKFAVYQCLNGLTDAASPIVIEGQHVANVFVGQFLLQPPQEEFFRRQAAEFGFDEKDYLEALRQVPVISSEKLPALLNYMTGFAVLVGTLGLERFRQRRSEARLAVRNRELVREREAALNLAEDAEQARMDTERSRAELRESEERFRATFEQAAVGIAHVSLGGRFLRINQRFCEIVRYTREEMLQRSFQDITHPEDLQANIAHVSRMLAEEVKTTSMEKRYRRKDGSVIWVNLTLSFLRRPDGTPDHFVSVVEDITERKQTEEELRLSEKRTATLLQLSQMTDQPDHAITDFALERAVEMTGSRIGYLAFVSEDEAVLKMHSWSRNAMAECMIDEKPKVYPVAGAGLWGEAVRQRKPIITNDYSAPNPLKRGYPEGHVAVLRHMNVPIFDGGKIVLVAGVGNKPVPYTEGDVQQLLLLMDGLWRIVKAKHSEEEKGKIEARFLQAQKMESVGRLAGGVAHDFNNMLGVIIGNAELASMQMHPSDPFYKSIQEILKASRRSADLVRQLLAFARKQTISPKVLDLNETIEGMLKMLRRLIGEDVDLIWIPGHDLWPVKIDPSQVDQVLANLTVNARDAIAGVGNVTMETQNVTVDETHGSGPAVMDPGDYVLLAVSDDGEGMGKEVLEHVFEPFFTTKEVGKGTGLGLATVYGIVKQNKGFINVSSEEKKGTTFSIYLPRVRIGAVAGEAEEMTKTLQGGNETVLVVEDEPAILEIGKAMLESLSYRVLTAHTPREAIRIAVDHPGAIHLLLTDVVMPEMNGGELAKQLKMIHPGLKCVYMSGYTADVIAHHGVLDEGILFIHKPFSMREMAAKIREALDGR